MNTLSLLFVAILGLLVGPALGSLGARTRAIRQLVDGFAVVLVAGLCLVFVLPHVVSELGLWGLGLAVLGLFAPFIVHRLGSGRRWALALACVVLTVHVVVDGTLLFTSEHHEPLGWAIVAHRLPVGFAIVMGVQALRAPGWVTWAVASLMAAGTGLGFLLAPAIQSWLPAASGAMLEALVAGTLLHVLFTPHVSQFAARGHDHATHDNDHHHVAAHAVHDHAAHDHGAAAHDGAHEHAAHDHGGGHAVHGAVRAARRANAWATLGVVLGLFSLVLIGSGGAHHAQYGATSFVRAFGILVFESAPALVLGYAMAGIVPLLLTPSRISSLARSGKIAQALRGVAFGLPLPVCSCGVLPLYESLIRRGAPLTAAMAFFVATPELGLDAVLLSVPLLGSSLTIARVVAAFIVAVLVGLLVARGGQDRAPEETASAAASEQSWSVRAKEALRFGFVEVFDHTMPWICLGLVIAAMAEPMLSADALGQIPRTLQVPLAAIVGIPVYVCASGATPVAALALHKGMSAGAAIAFLIAGPATNVTTFGTLAQLHGRRTAVRFGVVVTLLAVLAGWLVDALGITAPSVLDGYVEPPHESLTAQVSVVLLVALTLASLVRQGPRGAVLQILKPIHAH